MPAIHVPAGDPHDGLVVPPGGIVRPLDLDPFHRRLHHIAPGGLLNRTTQTTGMQRFEAISGKTWNHPVIARGRLYARNSEEIACYQLAMPDTHTAQVSQPRASGGAVR